MIPKAFGQLAGLIALFYLTAISYSIAQSRVISGTIKDENDKALPGVNIIVIGTTIGTISDNDGKYSLSVSSDNTILRFTFVGYEDIERAVGGLTILDLSMRPSTSLLNEVTVTGYGVQEKKDITGSIDVAKEKELNAVPTSNIENNLQGRFSGVNVITSGQPGSPAQVSIRGISTFAGTSSPLYVVDGNPTLDITTFNMMDVESITVLKDAGAASIYGSRAGNGVILITTRKGKSGAMKVSYSGYGGVQAPAKRITGLLDSQGFAELYWLAYNNSGQSLDGNIYGNGPTPVIPDYYTPPGKFEGDPEVDPSLYSLKLGEFYQISRANKTGTNWFDEVTQKAPIQNHAIDISGGNQNATYFVGLNYFNQQGIVDYTNSVKYSFRTNTEFKINEHVRVGENVTWNYRSNSYMGNPSGIGGTDVGGSSIRACYTSASMWPVYDIMGNFARGGNIAVISPYETQYRSKDNYAFDVRLFGNFYAEVDFLKYFTFRSAFGGSMQNGNSHYLSNFIYNASTFSESSFYAADWNWQNILRFKKELQNHSISGIAGLEAIESNIGRSLGGTRSGYISTGLVPDAYYYTLSNGNATNQTNYGNVNTPATLFGYFGRIDYGYKDRYLASFTIRRDGSSKFVNDKWGTFPSMTLGWRASETNLLKSTGFIDDLKLRVGYGVMGDQNSAVSANSYSSYTADAQNSYYDISGQNNSAQPGYARIFIGNPNGQWQRNITANVGLDFAFFYNKLSGSIDFYKKTTDKLLFAVDNIGTNGFSAAAFKNVGTIENKGIDLNLAYRTSIGRDWKFNSLLTFTTYKNKVVEVASNVPYFDPGPYGTGYSFVRIQPGQATSAFFGYKVAGLWQSQAEIDAANANAPDGVFEQEAAPGRFRYADINGVDEDGKLTGKPDGKIDDNDRTFIGNPNPKFSSGLNLSLTYKNIDLTLFFYGVYGNDILNMNKYDTDFFNAFLSGGSKSKEVLYDSWLPDRTDAKLPIAETQGYFSTSQASSSFFIEDGSYLRLKNLQIGYTFPREVSAKAGMSSARVYLQAVNLFTITKYSGLDPELSGSPLNFGIDRGNYPNARQFIFGLRINF